MAIGSGVTPAQQEAEDPLAYLPCSTILEFAKGDIIYAPRRPSTSLYLIIDGRVKVQRMIGKKVAVLVDIYQQDELFGESAFTGSSEGSEMAITLETARVMTWPRNQVEELMPNRPRLAIALLQLLTQRCRYLAQRIESCSYDCLDRRLARTLIHFSERFGRIADDGSTQIMPLSHKLIAQYLGTSRENVTHFMIDLRRNGCVEYSRTGIVVYPDAIRAWLRTATQLREYNPSPPRLPSGTRA